jgi:adenylate cyclase
MGEQKLKNSTEPVRAYRVLMDPRDSGKTIGARRKASRSWRWVAAGALALPIAAVVGVMMWPRDTPCLAGTAQPVTVGQSVAVLPFDNLSGDPQQEPIVDGLADDLTTALSRIRDLFVIARHSSYAYKGLSCDLRRVAKELGVRHLIEGSVQRSHDQLRINVQLIDGASGGHEWAESFEGTSAQVFDLQTQVVQGIADALALRLTKTEQESLLQTETRVPAAYEAFLRGWEYIRRDTPESYSKAIPDLEEATKLDPNYGRAFAALALAYISSYDARWTDSLGISEREARARAVRYLEEAKRRPSALSHQVAAIILWIDRQPNGALAELKDALALDPGDAFSYAYMGAVLTAAGRPTEALAYIHTAMRLDPHYPAMFDYFLGSAQFGMENFEAAAASFSAATQRNPDYEYAYVALAAADGHLGRKRDAASAVARYNALRVARGGVPLTIGTATIGGFTVRDGVQRLWSGLRLAGVPEFLFNGDFASEHRVSAHAIRALVFGHRLHGRSLWHGEERAATVTKDGVVAMSGDWGLLGEGPLTGGRAEFEGDRLCYRFGLTSYCGDVFRNPGGTKAKENEFIWYNGEAFTFSVTE